MARCKGGNQVCDSLNTIIPNKNDFIHVIRRHVHARSTILNFKFFTGKRYF